ncbi:hypothetical protein B0H12DRAFT_1067555 [Mycena haematopus]|nr:hypothetical protein B0H12DRAFT_1067555 [Mycena haematopus]
MGIDLFADSGWVMGRVAGATQHSATQRGRSVKSNGVSLEKNEERSGTHGWCFDDVDSSPGLDAVDLRLLSIHSHARSEFRHSCTQSLGCFVGRMISLRTAFYEDKDMRDACDRLAKGADGGDEGKKGVAGTRRWVR